MPTTPARYAQALFEETVKLGEANVRRIHGDFGVGGSCDGTAPSSCSPSFSIVISMIFFMGP